MARKREFDKDAVLEKAMVLFWEKGYEATSIRALKDVMEISSSSMYETFGDKRSIFLLALTRYCEIERKQVAQMEQEAESATQFIEYLFDSIANIAPDMPHADGSMALNTMVEFGKRDADVTEILFEHYLAISEIVGNGIAKGQTAQEISAHEEPHNLAQVILSTLYGLTTIKSLKPDFIYEEAFKQAFLRLLKA